VKITEPQRDDNWSPEDLIVGALETCLLTAHRQCLIANSIKAEVTIQPDIELSVSE